MIQLAQIFLPAAKCFLISVQILFQAIKQTFQVDEDASNWTYVTQFSVPSAGFVSCSSLKNPGSELETKVEIYLDAIAGNCLHCKIRQLEHF